MEAIAGWTLALLLRLLGAVQWSWAWTPAGAPYSYLNAAQRPLWILEDELMKHQRADRLEADYGTTTTQGTTALVRMRQDRELRPPPIRIVVRPDAPPPPPPPPLPLPLLAPHYQRPHRLQLPSHYVQQRSQTPSMFRRQPRTELRRRQPQSLPIFDNAPGDNTLSATSYPIFVYNGTKGELLVNTMLSAQRYPMQEPVPGQILYPPSTPMFRPKPIVEHFRVPGQRQLLNLTLIPFYAHEAITSAPITTAQTTFTDSSTYPTASVVTSSVTPSVTSTVTPVSAVAFAPSAPEPTVASTLASAPATDPDTVADTTFASVTTSPRPYETQLPRSKRRRNPKKAKQYDAYRSPQEVVQRQPVLRGSPAPAAPNNHRHQLVEETEFSARPEESLEHLLLDEELDQELDSEIEKPLEELELEEQQPLDETTSDRGSSSLQIVYMDESLESPTDTVVSTTAVPHLHRQSSRYSMTREYFAFPVYTLGKLLQNPKGDQIKMGHIVKLDDSTEHGDTWFILNSRYKGPHHNAQKMGQSKYFTSKYVQNPKGNRR